MKILSIATLAALGLLPLNAGIVVESYEKAQAVSHKDGYVLAAYPHGWDKKGEKKMRRCLGTNAILDAAGDTAIIPVPVAQITDDASKKQLEQILGSLKLPKATSYPAFFLLDATGRHYATLAEPGMRHLKIDDLAVRLSARIQDGHHQKALLDKAASLPPGIEKAKLLGQAAELPNLHKPQDILKSLRESDPQDTLGYIRRISFNPWAFASSTAKNMSFEEAENKIKEMLEDSAYTAEQKQKIYATYIGLIRRQAAPDSVQRMAELLKTMTELNPDSLLAKSAPIAARQWLKSFSLLEGWCPASMPANDEKPIVLADNLAPLEPGTYYVTFRYTSGRFRLDVAAVELYDGDKKIAEDRHAGYTGHSNNGNVYTLKIGTAVEKPRILVYLNMKGNRDSSGLISFKKQR